MIEPAIGQRVGNVHGVLGFIAYVDAGEFHVRPDSGTATFIYSADKTRLFARACASCGKLMSDWRHSDCLRCARMLRDAAYWALLLKHGRAYP